eukprot:CAMPEP_0113936900 /NCGR_PEP_ID=MMETSP1339-20121228/3650_1 /TAXON_ID=94617 /ORGANISM="Fibrocapsa japonica" /LENGTH=96 /DNA_ID=CAMNT_0000939471 /DNA_START=322 /DNA_END=612 /DNA_ORIENTATION=- /assembly_acc=CAM_ASM_000762
MLTHFTFRPRQPTANPADLPFFLSTNPLAEMEAEERQTVAASSSCGGGEGNMSEPALKALEEKVDKYNSRVQSLESFFEHQSTNMMKSLNSRSHTK